MLVFAVLTMIRLFWEREKRKEEGKKEKEKEGNRNQKMRIRIEGGKITKKIKLTFFFHFFLNSIFLRTEALPLSWKAQIRKLKK
jgi:hypothetical protein